MEAAAYRPIKQQQCRLVHLHTLFTEDRATAVTSRGQTAVATAGFVLQAAFSSGLFVAVAVACGGHKVPPSTCLKDNLVTIHFLLQLVHRQAGSQTGSPPTY